MLTCLDTNSTIIKHLEKFPDKNLINENLSDIANIMLYQSSQGTYTIDSPYSNCSHNLNRDYFLN